jgi:hypothetical protein
MPPRARAAVDEMTSPSIDDDAMDDKRLELRAKRHISNGNHAGLFSFVKCFYECF